MDFDALWREGMRPDSPEARRARAEHPTAWDWIISRFRLVR
ncbi:hypothetical protein SEA_MAGRITTE_156 [Microbacterium phage Magritte]|nr:hypothetical protein SEA_MAGRITTE_156 [Microbacterium phage Magritte]